MNTAGTSEGDWMTHPGYFDLGTEWVLIGLFVVIGMYLFLVAGMKLRPVWAFVGIALLPFTFVLLICWSLLPVWLTRTILVAGVVDQVYLRGKSGARILRTPPSGSTRYSRN